MNPKQRRAMFAKQRVKRVPPVKITGKPMDLLAHSEGFKNNPKEYISYRAKRGALIGAAVGVPLFPVGSIVGAGIGYHVGKKRAKKAVASVEMVRRVDDIRKKGGIALIGK